MSEEPLVRRAPMTSAEKKERMARVVAKLLDEEGLTNALTSEELSAMLKRAWKHQADLTVSVLVRNLIDGDLQKLRAEFAPQLRETFEKHQEWSLSAFKITLREMARDFLYQHFKNEAGAMIKQAVTEEIAKMQFTITTEKKS